jgi:peptide/nickel transport system ATP-binding protein
MSSTRAPEAAARGDVTAPLLEIADLRVAFASLRGLAPALRGVDLVVQRGEVLGLVGESGSGKSVTGLAALRLLDPNAHIEAKALRFDGVDLLPLGEGGMRELRGARLAMIFQDPAMTLNPVLRIDTQMIEAVTAHVRVGRREARERCRAALERVGIADAERRLNSYPHEFSGGMRQRVAIAIALLHRPALIVADEPTTALDVTIQAQILVQVERLCREAGTALLWITHDLGVVARIADRLAVMYAGRIVEEGPVGALLEAPRHPYTAGLIASMPAGQKRGERLHAMPPGGPFPEQGCAFAPRCPRAATDCRAEVPPMFDFGAGQRARCIHPLP